LGRFFHQKSILYVKVVFVQLKFGKDLPAKDHWLAGLPGTQHVSVSVGKPEN